MYLVRKTAIIALLMLILTASFSCSDKSNIKENDSENEIAENEKSYPAMSEISADLIENYSFPNMYTVPQEQIESDFGINLSDFSDVSASVTTEYPGIERVFLGVAKDEESLENAKEQLNIYFDMLKAEYIDYLPAEYKKAKNVEIYTNENFICLIVCSDYKEALKYVKAEIE